MLTPRAWLPCLAKECGTGRDCVLAAKGCDEVPACASACDFLVCPEGPCEVCLQGSDVRYGFILCMLVTCAIGH